MPWFLLLIACGSGPSDADPAKPSPTTPAASDKRVPSGLHTDRLRGVCDGSAAVRLPDGDLLVAYDEDTALHRYSPSGAWRGTAPLYPLLGTPPEPEYDLEAAALVDHPSGPMIWWAGSHGRDGDDELAPMRQRFFATNVPAQPDLSDLSVVAVADLGPILLADPEVAARLGGEVVDRGAKDGGVNLEAMASHPDGGLLLGFRSPLSGPDGRTGTALVVHLEGSGGEWTVADSHELPLGNRGLRDLAWDGAGWRAIAGPVDDGDFALFRVGADYTVSPWGEPSWVEGLRPEAVVQRVDGGWMLLSDDGKVKRGDATAEDGDRGCDKIRRKHGRGHPEVYLRTRVLPRD